MKRRLTTAAMLGVLLAASSPAVAAVTVDVQATGSVGGAFVCLGEVALVTGDETGSLASLAICPAPLAGESLGLSAERIRRRVVAAMGGVDFTLSGEASCRVTRQTAEAVKAKAAAAEAVAAPVTGTTLEELVRLYVADRLERPTGDVRVEFDPRDKEFLSLADEKYQFRFVSATHRVSPGNSAVRVEVYDRASPRLVVRSVHLKFTVVLLEDVVVAARAVRLGRIITEQDLRVERREFRDTPRMLLHEVADMVGTTAKRNIEVGQVLAVEDMQKTLMVERGNAVTVILEGRGLRIKTTCRAMESGELGSAVAVQGVDGRGKFYATVTGPRTVEVRLAGAPSPQEEAPAVETDQGRKVAQAVPDASRATANQGDR